MTEATTTTVRSIIDISAGDVVEFGGMTLTVKDVERVGANQGIVASARHRWRRVIFVRDDGMTAARMFATNETIHVVA